MNKDTNAGHIYPPAQDYGGLMTREDTYRIRRCKSDGCEVQRACESERDRRNYLMALAPNGRRRVEARVQRAAACARVARSTSRERGERGSSLCFRQCSVCDRFPIRLPLTDAIEHLMFAGREAFHCWRTSCPLVTAFTDAVEQLRGDSRRTCKFCTSDALDGRHEYPRWTLQRGRSRLRPPRHIPEYPRSLP